MTSPDPPTSFAPAHGGQLRLAAARYGIALPDWLDLSTGINPHGWPVPTPPPWTWARLPEDDDGLEEAARRYYGVENLLPVAGSQAAIRALPRLRPRSRVSVTCPGYVEHAKAWRDAGHEVQAVRSGRLDRAASESDVLVVTNPDNPTGTRFQPGRLLDWHARLRRRGGWLVVDEAFMDPTPADSLCHHTGNDGLIVLRSLGKFFGLAGLRVGFVCAEPRITNRLAAHLGPWTVNTPGRWVAARALADHLWQDQARARLARESARLRALLARHGLAPRGGCALFQWAVLPDARALFEGLARRGILTRHFSRPSSVRVGLPAGEPDWRRLERGLANLMGHRSQGLRRCVPAR